MNLLVLIRVGGVLLVGIRLTNDGTVAPLLRCNNKHQSHGSGRQCDLWIFCHFDSVVRVKETVQSLYSVHILFHRHSVLQTVTINTVAAFIVTMSQFMEQRCHFQLNSQLKPVLRPEAHKRTNTAFLFYCCIQAYGLYFFCACSFAVLYFFIVLHLKKLFRGIR